MNKKLKVTIVVFLISSIVLLSCGKAYNKDAKPYEIVTTGSMPYYSVSAVDYYTSGMHYKIFSSPNGQIFVVNITKDSVDILKKF